MKILWPEKFEENDLPAAKTVIEEQAKLLSKLTAGVVFASVSELEPFDPLPVIMKNDFAYRFDIRGKVLEGYKFNVLTFSHDITLYPLKVRLDEKIGQELGIKKNIAFGFLIDIDTPAVFEAFLEGVLRSERLKSVIGSIMRLSK